MKVDPIAGMRCWAVDVTVGDTVVTIPPLPAVDWWPLLADGAGASTMIGLLPDSDRFDEELLAGRIDGEELASAFLEAVQEVSGRTLAEAQVIAGVAEAGWMWIGGALAQRGFRWDVMPLGAALDAVHALVLERLSDEDRKKYEQLLAQAAPEKLDRGRAISEFEAAAGPRPQATAAPSGDTPPRTRTPSRPPRPRAPRAAPMPPPP